MFIHLDGDELEIAIIEYLLARGVNENSNFEIKIIGGRRGNKSQAEITVNSERQTPVKQKTKTYTEPEPLDHNPYEEEEEIVTEDSVTEPGAIISPFTTEEPVEKELGEPEPVRSLFS